MVYKRFVLIVAGGSGKRMGAPVPKQFLPLAGKPILMHTLSVFYQFNPLYPIYLVLPQNEIETWESLCLKSMFKIPHTIVKGGETRFDSVKNGLNAIDGQGFVAIHDGVRPMVSLGVIERCFETAERLGNAIPAVKPVETIRLGSEDLSKVIDRNQVWLIQTPQVFNLERIRECYRTPYRQEFTDDASVAEAFGEKINIVKGNLENIKITNQSDLLFAQALMQASGFF